MPGISFIPQGPIGGSGAGLAGIQGVNAIFSSFANMQQSQVAQQLAQSQIATQQLEQQKQGLALQLAQDPTSGALAQQNQNFQQQQAMNPIALALAKANASSADTNAKVSAAYQGQMQEAELDKLKASVQLTKMEADAAGTSSFVQKMTAIPQIMSKYQELKEHDAVIQSNLASAGEAIARGAFITTQNQKELGDAAASGMYGKFISDPSVPAADRLKVATWYMNRNLPNQNLLSQIPGLAGNDVAAQMKSVMTPWLKAQGIDPKTVPSEKGASTSGTVQTDTVPQNEVEDSVQNLINVNKLSGTLKFTTSGVSDGKTKIPSYDTSLLGENDQKAFGSILPSTDGSSKQQLAFRRTVFELMKAKDPKNLLQQINTSLPPNFLSDPDKLQLLKYARTRGLLN